MVPSLTRLNIYANLVFPVINKSNIKVQNNSNRIPLDDAITSEVF